VPKGVSNALNCIHQFGDAFKGEEFTLDRYEDGIRGDKGIQGKEIQRGRAIDQDEVVLFTEWCDFLLQAKFPPIRVHKLKIGAYQVLVARYEVEPFEPGMHDGVCGFRAAQQDMVEASAGRVFTYAQAGSGVPLGVGIDDQNMKIVGGQGCSHVNGGRRFSDSALLIGYCEDFPQAVRLSRFQILVRFT
jgi:hypothetical protein